MRWWLLVALVLCGACAPEIARGSYYCGPEMLCPPELSCDLVTYTCESTSAARPFECPDNSEDGEPNDADAAATDLGSVQCGNILVSQLMGCIASGEDVDYIAFDHLSECNGDDPHLDLALRYPYATAPLGLELVDEAGQVVAEGEISTPSGDSTGHEWVTLEADIEPGRYYIRIQIAPDAPDCDGDCRHNQYRLDISLPLA